MKIAYRKFGLGAAATVLALQQATAWAQAAPNTVLVSYAPAGATASIPTLSEWAMLGLALALAALAVYTLRNKRGAKPLASVILAFGLAIGGMGGNRLMGDAHAAPGGWAVPDCTSWTACSMLNAGGGTVTTGPTGNVVTITNLTGVAQTVTGVSATPPATLPPNQTPPTCMVGLVVQPNGICTIYNANLA